VDIALMDRSHDDFYENIVNSNLVAGQLALRNS